ncbi:MAG: methionine biosynthesis protein MetW, partial [Alphaproteobacteria bacterium]|nr:methionine biosynthesis protein MetW [Alphaproteobacteria bacterium]
MIASGARVLDIGCGDGDLLHFLQRERNIDGRGMELSQDGVNASVSRGLSVVQGDADTDLVDYPNGAFDVVILS